MSVFLQGYSSIVVSVMHVEQNWNENILYDVGFLISPKRSRSLSHVFYKEAVAAATPFNITNNSPLIPPASYSGV